ncbi:hypothetical protein A7318_28045 (plasmid) [Pseudomonas lurida]|uniref:hypothetical protein n=1 Tax=Pseudomonas lurida TaxID=244566 RepID=UPI00083DF0EA|nr:hypothetical protein [Pseudomonas lurida]AOE82498.1 hypothetical protein A7318_28045 [Pseudomonas lurida]
MSKHEVDVGGKTVGFEMTDDGPEVTMDGQKVQLGMDGGFRGFNAFGSKAEKVEGGMLITKENGFQIKMLDAGGYELVSPLKSVGISDLSEVAEYKLTRDGDILTHAMTFINGGTAQIGYKNGQPGELTSLRVQHTITNEGELYLGVQKPNEV